MYPNQRARLRPRGSEVLKHVRASPKIGISTAVFTDRVVPLPTVPAPVSHGPRRLRSPARVSPSAHVDTTPGGTSGAKSGAAGGGGGAERGAAQRRSTPRRTLTWSGGRVDGMYVDPPTWEVAARILRDGVVVLGLA